MRKKKQNVEKTVSGGKKTEPTVVFPEKYVEAAHIIMAISIFKSFKEEGLLTEEEFDAITKDEIAHWNSLLSPDNVNSERIIIREEPQ